MEQQKKYSSVEIEYIMSCCEANHDGLIDYREVTERFHEPAREIGFNLAVLLTNLSEHMPSDPRLQRFLEISSSVLTYFEPFLGRIEIMGSSKRVERVYFEIKESSINQWEKPQIKESKRAFFYSIVTEGGDKEKLELFVNFCEDAIFEMQHAASISMEEEEEPKKSSEYPFLGDESKSSSILDPLKKVFKFIFSSLWQMFSYLTPSNIKKQMNTIKEKSVGELSIGLIMLLFKTIFFSGFAFLSLIKSIFKFILRLMTGEPIAGPIEGSDEDEPQKALIKVASPFSLPETVAAQFPAILPIEATPTTASSEKRTESVNDLVITNQQLQQIEESKKDGKSGKDVDSDGQLSDKTSDDVAGKLKESNTDSRKSSDRGGVGENNINRELLQIVEDEESEIPKTSESTSIFASFNIANYAHRFICFLARNFYTLKYIALMIAFIINFILLFYRVTDTPINGDIFASSLGIVSGSSDSDQDAYADDIGGDESGSGDGDDVDDDLNEWVAIEERLFYLSPVIRILALLHSTLAFFMLIGYYYLKLPLAIFKREKEISRSMEFDGLYISGESDSDDIRAQWDKLVISTPSFPVNYWDKFVKKRVRETYSEQYDYDQISNLLGMDKGDISSKQEEPSGCLNFFTTMDIKYQIWKAGVTITDSVSNYHISTYTRAHASEPRSIISDRLINQTE